MRVRVIGIFLVESDCFLKYPACLEIKKLFLATSLLSAMHSNPFAYILFRMIYYPKHDI